VMSDRALAAAERAGLVNIAAEALSTKGVIAMYQGRLWEARALLVGARLLAEEHNQPDVAMRTMNMLAATVAHDDPAEALRLERAAIELARQLGRRSAEMVTLGNAAEDARRTGDWAWAIEELEAAIDLDLDESTQLTLRAALALLQCLRGQLAPDVLQNILAGISRLEDSDTKATAFDLQAHDALLRGEYRSAYENHMLVIGISDLNAPYSLPRAGHAAVLAGDVDGARAALAQLDALGTRGRAVDADRAGIRAGIAAIEGDPAAAVAAYRTAIEAFRDLGLPWDEALTALSAAKRIGPDAPGVREWVETARATFIRLEAAPILGLLDDAMGVRPDDGETPMAASRSASIEGIASRT
jgi:tetratricopeptide (TPR) repeat protein